MILQFSPMPEFHVCRLKRFAAGERHVTRIMAESVLILMLQGTLCFCEDGEEKEIKAGEYYVQRGGLLQEGRQPCPDAVYYYVHFQGSFGEGEEGFPCRGVFSKQALLPMLERLSSLCDESGVDPFRMNAQMLCVLSELLIKTRRNDSVGGVAYRLKNYLDTQYAEQISLEGISRDFGYTKDYLIRIFKERYGIPPHRYLIERRMEQARWLLKSTSLSAEQIAEAVGYSDFSAFYRAFCKAYGVSPRVMRQSK